MNERLYIITYDIRDAARLRRIHRTLKGFGEWVQYSVFQCRLSARRLVELRAQVETVINFSEDHVLFVDVGPADAAELRFTSLGKGFDPIERSVTIV